MPRQVVLKDSLQTLESYPRVRPSEGYALAQPTTAQCRVRSPSETETAFAACTLDTLEGTVSTAGEEGDQTLTVQIEADVVRLRRYLLELSTGEQLWVRAQDGVTATLTAATYSAIIGAAAVGSDFEGEWFTLEDATGQEITFEWDTGGGVTGGRTAIALLAGDDALTVATKTANAITAVGATLRITAGAPALNVDLDYAFTLTQDDAGAVGNTSVTSGTANILGANAFTGGAAAAKTVRLMSPLPCDVTVNSVLYGMRCSRALTALETALEGPGIIDWRVYDGATLLAEWSEQFEVVRRMPRWELDEDELLRRMPEARALVDASDVTLEETISAALEEHLLPRLRAKRDNFGNALRESNIISTWPLVPAQVAAVRLFLTNNDPTKTKELRDEARAEMLQVLDLALEDADGWYDAPQSETPSVNAERGTFGVLRYTR